MTIAEVENRIRRNAEAHARDVIVNVFGQKATPQHVRQVADGLTRRTCWPSC